MIINLSPQRRDDALEVIKTGETLTINGAAIDFSVIPDGAELPASAVDCEFIVGTVSRMSGVLHLTVLMPFARAAPEIINPAPVISPADGRIPLPTDEAA